MNKLDKMLINHNIIPGYMGYNYIREIINSELNISGSNIVAIYEEIGNMFNVTPSSVERAIRHILNKSNLVEKKNKLALAYLQVEYEGLI